MRGGAWRWLTPGTAFVVLTLVASSAGFNLYFRHFNSYPRVYGALGRLHHFDAVDLYRQRDPAHRR